jgi:hypothetical protein
MLLKDLLELRQDQHEWTAPLKLTAHLIVTFHVWDVLPIHGIRVLPQHIEVFPPCIQWSHNDCMKGGIGQIPLKGRDIIDVESISVHCSGISGYIL